MEKEFEQVVLNIINNAKDAFIERKIKEPEIIITLTNETITLEDNAGGIPENKLYNIFEAYFTTKEEGVGTGMGLYMSKIIIEEHFNGKISASNTKNGASFHISLGKQLVV